MQTLQQAAGIPLWRNVGLVNGDDGEIQLWDHHRAGFAQNVGGLDRGLFPSYDIPPADAGSDRISRTGSLGSLSVCTDFGFFGHPEESVAKKDLKKKVSNLANTVLCRAN